MILNKNPSFEIQSLKSAKMNKTSPIRNNVFITARPMTKLFAGGGGGEWRTCAMIDDEPMVENPGVGRLMTRDGPM